MDHFEWIQAQGKLFAEKKFDEIDAQFFELAVNAHRRTLFGYVSTVLEQFLMVDFFPDLNEWVAIERNLDSARASALLLLDDSPSLRPVLEAEYPQIWRGIRIQVKETLGGYLPAGSFLPKDNPYSLDTLLDHKVLPEHWDPLRR